jgi:hypothetical protein
MESTHCVCQDSNNKAVNPLLLLELLLLAGESQIHSATACATAEDFCLCRFDSYCLHRCRLRLVLLPPSA